MTVTFKTTKKKQILDITEEVQQYLKDQKVESGLCHLFVKHTTAALTTADLDAGGTDQDYLDAFEEIMPKLNYRHPHNPGHVVDHILSSIIGPDVTIPIYNGELDLGVWQRAILVELDGPREREIIVSIIEL
jgi:secondary thiamine-phosphate synthase enzyme